MTLLPRQPLFALAEQMPLAVIGGRVYLLLDEQGHNKNWLQFAGQMYSLVSAQTLPELEEAYEGDYATELEQYQKSFLQAAAGQGLAGAQEMEQLIAEDRILDFLVKRMLPRLHRLYHWSAPPLQLPDLESGDEAQSPGSSAGNHHRHCTRGLLAAVLGGDMLFLDERGYRLTAIDAAEAEWQREVIVSCKGRVYCPSASGCFLYEIEQRFQWQLMQALEQQAPVEAAEQAEQLRQVKERKERWLAGLGLRQLANDGTVYLYRDEWCGIVKLGPNWWVYLEIPEEFVYEDHKAPGTFYRFDPTRVGVRLIYDRASKQVSFENARVEGARAAFVLTSGYEHMYVDANNGSICQGPYTWAWWTADIKLEDAICKYLINARDTILSGYRPDTQDISPVHKLEEFPHRRISLWEIEQRGLRITNRF